MSVKTSQDFSLYTGNDKRPEITVYDEEDNTVNLDGASIDWVAFDPSDGTEIMRKSTSEGSINISDPHNGKFLVKIDASDTDSISSDVTLEHEAQVTMPSGLKDHVTTGSIEVTVSSI